MNLSGRYRCEVKIEDDGPGMNLRLSGFDQSLRTMGGAGLVLAPGTTQNPNSSITFSRNTNRHTLRSAFVIEASTGATKERLAANVAAFLNGAGMSGLGTNAELAAALLACRRGGNVCLSVASMGVRRSSGASRGAPVPEPVPPVPLSLPERIASGPVVQATNPAEVGQTPRVVGADTLQDLATWAGQNWLLALGLGGLAVVGGVLLARRGKRRG